MPDRYYMKQQLDGKFAIVLIRNGTYITVREGLGAWEAARQLKQFREEANV